MRRLLVSITLLIIVLLGITVYIKAQGGIGPDGKYIPPVQLSYLYPDYDDFKGKIRYYEWKKFRRIDSQYLKPDIGKWVSSLIEVKKPDLHQKHIKIWYQDKEVRYFYVQDDTSFFRHFYAVNGDTIDVAVVMGDSISSMLTPVGVGYWRYFYKDGRMRAEKSYDMTPDVREPRKLSDRLWGVRNYLYFDEEREIYFDSTEFKDKSDWIDYRT